jgi:hypothetical protein
MKLKVIEDYDSQFSLEPEAQATLFSLLESDTFRRQVAERLGCVGVEFTQELFQPVPYSLNTPKGMPPEFESYYNNPEVYGIINVPPNFMFKAKIFKPSRLCCIYRKLV